jgi:Ser/Thr protein kinase RdoA (MazF antagonist)
LEKRITERFSAEVLEEASRRYGVSSGELKKLDGFESFIFKYTQNGAGFVLRIAHSLRRSEKLIRGEVDWIRYLASNGVSVADAVPSALGNLVETIPDGHGGSFLAAAFNEVKGNPPWECGWTPELFFRYGALIGSMHRLAKSYLPSEHEIRRPLWDSPEINSFVLPAIPADQPLVKKRYEEIVSCIKCLPTDSDSFGLIHFDAHGGNMLVDETGIIHLFDFDDCNRNWFINDIAIVLFYMTTNVQNPEGAAQEFLAPFLKGYASENSLASAWLAEVPIFLKMREIDLYAAIYRSLDVNNLSGWCSQFMDGRRLRIETEVPYLNIDFTKLAGCLN